ncbi:hypothetical protein E5K00_18010 [Hymenobacter aquaticus]|uniref:T9SS type A sorting domain-containing protein n=1 Tax=Hymenobacter aquaticus TaxID=1867101 RepID=A0A4Z0PXE9_9BACT|nr:hypothetical protein [Hymenobacter aquaticus]TGE22145.1 hypothetical protein E5K00_18010 [Hymenobacter aquaticus]
MLNRLLFCLLLLSLPGLGSLPVQASHILGGDLTYTYIGTSTSPNAYKVTARLYREYTLTPVNFGNEITLSVGLNGCPGATTGSFTALLQRVSTVTTTPLGCVGDFSYENIVFEGTVLLPPGQWTMSVNEENRTGGTRNVVDSGMYGFHLEAQLNNASGLRNNSPKFTSFTLPYLCGNQSHRYSFSTFEADGDSLVYQSVPPQRRTSYVNPCPIPLPYVSYSAGQFQDPASGQTVTYPARTYSAANPLFSFLVGGGVGTPYFGLNAATGELVARPILKETGPFVVAVRVDEFRKLNGSWTKIGSVLRDVVYSVFNGSGNRNPVLSSLSIGSSPAPFPLDLPIDVATGELISLNLTATDPDAGQTVRLSSDVASVIPGASFQPTGPNQGRLTWSVPTSLPSGLYSFTVTLADNGCPLNGTEVRTVIFRVSRIVLGTTPGRQPVVLAAFPVPFHDRVQFQLAAGFSGPVVVSDELGRPVARLTSRPDGLVVWQPDAQVPAGLYFARSADGRQVARLLRSDQP